MNNQPELDNVIANILTKMECMDPGSEEYAALANVLTSLTDRSIAMERVNQESIDKAAARDRDTKNDILEHNIKCEQLKDDHIDRLVKNVLTGLGIVLPICLTIWGTHASFKFEKDGVITTTLGRVFVNRLAGKK
jgi:hypothetical protein